MSIRVVGTCGNCGGRVVEPAFYHCVIPPVPTCESCGATVAVHGPVLPMNPVPERRYYGPTRRWPGIRRGPRVVPLTTDDSRVVPLATEDYIYIDQWGNP